MINIPARSCPACHRSNRAELGVKNSFQMLICKDCHSIYSSNLPANNESQDYDEYYTDENLRAPDFVQKSIEEILNSFAPYRTTGKMLDIGFGSANLMAAARAKDWQTEGMEVSKTAVEHAKEMGFSVFHGELTEANYQSDYFDVITASEIIEHCPQPEILLNEVFRILRPGGLFWATTPSAKSLSYKMIGLDWTVILPPEHLQLFSKEGIKLMLKKAGFSHSEIKTFGFNPLEVASHFRSRLRQSSVEKKEDFSRIETSYRLNENLTRSPARMKIKRILNWTLNALSVGDSLKIRAVK